MEGRKAYPLEKMIRSDRDVMDLDLEMDEKDDLEDGACMDIDTEHPEFLSNLRLDSVEEFKDGNFGKDVTKTQRALVGLCHERGILEAHSRCTRYERQQVKPCASLPLLQMEEIKRYMRSNGSPAHGPSSAPSLLLGR